MVTCARTRTAPWSSTATLVRSGNGALVPLTVSCARRSTVSPSMASAPVTTTLISGNFSTSKKSAERRCSSRLRILVSTDAARMSMRPKIVWVSVIWPSPPNSVKRPFTATRPHIDLALNAIADRCGSTFQTPTDAGLLRSSCALAMSPPRRICCPEQWGNLCWIEVRGDAADQPVCTQLDHDADPHRDRSAVASVGMQDVLLHESAVEKLAGEDLIAAVDGR